MISARLNGGLGNQLFQIATTYALAVDNNDECGFNFNMKPVNQGNSALTYRTNIYRKLKPLPLAWQPDYIYKEKRYFYTKIPYKKNMLLDGYFSGDQYFRKHKDAIIQLFKDETTLSQIKGQFENSVSIHVRHGDYLKLPRFFIQLPLSYYEKALGLLDKKTQIDRIYVLSDDIPWCKKNFKDDRIDFIEGLPDFVDLYVMSMCNHNILANSSFSWWGTYLNENPDKIVYSPCKWFGPQGIKNHEYLFCDNWIRI